MKTINTNYLDPYFLTFAQLKEEVIQSGIIDLDSKTFNPNIELFVIKESEKAYGLGKDQEKVLFFIPKKFVKK